MRQDVANQIRLEAEAKLREELQQIKDQLEKDRLLQQQQKQSEEQERARKHQEEDERLRAELRAMKEQLERQERNRLQWEQRLQKDSKSHAVGSRGRITLEDRLCDRVPSPPSPRRERVWRHETSDVEEGEMEK